MAGLRVRIQGVRGSVPVHGESFAQFGGGTNCVLYQAGDETIYLDAGSGLLSGNFPPAIPSGRISILLSHGHADHLIGFPLFPPFFDSARTCDIYLKHRNGRTAKEQVEMLMTPPLWPVGPDALRGTLRFHDVAPSFTLGDVLIETMEATHPGGVTLFKLTYQGVRVIYATDFEPDAAERDAFCSFARDCSLLLLDAQYTAEEYQRTKGFGHMTLQEGLDVAARCRAKKTLLIHHAPSRTDAQLLEQERNILAHHPQVYFARVGDEIAL